MSLNETASYMVESAVGAFLCWFMCQTTVCTAYLHVLQFSI